MSSLLPPELLKQFYDLHMDSNGTYTCAGYKRPPHGKFGRQLIQIDHIYPEKENPDLTFALSNLQPLCHLPGKGEGCHKAKTRDENVLRRAGKAHQLVAPNGRRRQQV